MAACERLTVNPKLGRANDELGKGVRRLLQGSHIIFYRLDADAVFILRILHKSMIPAKIRMRLPN